MSEELDPKRCPHIKGDGTQCRQTAGWGTNHKNRGPCNSHGGRAPNWDKHFETEMVKERMATYGSPIEVEPHVALLDEVKRTAGHVAWLSSIIGQLGEAALDGEGEDEEEGVVANGLVFDGLTQTNGKTLVQTPSVWIEMYQEERRMLARVR